MWSFFSEVLSLGKKPKQLSVTQIWVSSLTTSETCIGNFLSSHKNWFQNFTAVINVAAPSVLIWILCDDELCHFLSATRFRLIKHTRLNVVAFLNELPKTQHDIASLIVDVNTYTVSQTCGFLLAWFTIRFAVLIASVFFAGYIVDIYSQWSFQREWVPSKIIESYKCRFSYLSFSKCMLCMWKMQKIEPHRNSFLWRWNVSEVVCKRDWQREDLFIF